MIGTALLALSTFAVGSSAGGPLFTADWTSWRVRRAELLRAPDGWLALVGLHWLSPGENRIPGLPGTFTLDGGKVRLDAPAAAGYVLAGKPLTSAVLATDATHAADRVTVGSRTLMVIDRGGKLAVRVWDAESPARKGFHGIDAFPPDPRWRVVGRWEPYPQPRQVEVPSVVGIPSIEKAPGRVHFELAGRALALEPTVEEDGTLFFVFRDATAGEETYGAGRFLSADPARDGKVVLDFNRARNPPCAFTPFATCPLPLPQNVLPVRIEAGEKKWGDH